MHIKMLQIEKCEKMDFSTLGLIKQIHELWRNEMVESETKAEKSFD